MKHTDTYKVCEHLALTRELKDGFVEGILIGDALIWGCGDCGSPWFNCVICNEEVDHTDLSKYPLENK